MPNYMNALEASEFSCHDSESLLYEVFLSLINARPHQSNLSVRGDRKIKRTEAGLTKETSTGGEIRKMGSRFGEF